MTYLKNRLSLLFVAACLSMAILPWAAPIDQARANLEVCDTWDDWSGYCHGKPTDCYCEVVITPE